MSADWHPDPLGRAQFRYYDGSAWTHHVATNGQQTMEPGDMPLTMPIQAFPPPLAYPYVAPPTGPRGGRLVAAGVLAIISGAFTALISVVLLVIVANPNAFNTCTADSVCAPRVVSEPGVLTAVAVFFMLIGALFVVAGIGGCMRKHWGQIMIITIGSLGVLLYLIVLATRGQPQLIIPVVWFSTVVGLAVGIDRAVFERPTDR